MKSMETSTRTYRDRENMPSARREFFDGIRAELPILLGVMPFGMIYGVLALSAGIPPGPAQAMSLIVFAGSAQFISTQLIPAATPVIVIIFTFAIVNLRHALYSASVAPYLKPLKPIWKWVLAYLLTDEAYVVTITHYSQPRPAASGAEGISHSDQRHWFFLGSGLALWSTWQASTAAGILLGTVVPESWSLEFTLPLTFIAVVVPALKDRSSLAAALTAGLVAVLASGLPFKLGLAAAALMGIGAGLWIESRH